MALELDPGVLSNRIDALRSGWTGYAQRVRTRNAAYLRAFSPDFEERIGEHDQWSDAFHQEDADHFRSSYNLTRAVGELWTSLEASDYPSIRWYDGFVPTPAPSMDEQEAAARGMEYRAVKIANGQVSTMREQVLQKHLRRSKAKRHFYSAALRKNVYGHSWLKTWPDESRKTFCVATRIDPSTVFPVWSYADDDEGRLDAILVAYRRSAASVNAQYPGLLPMVDGVSVSESGYYIPTQDRVTDADRAYVWVEDYWYVDALWSEEPHDGGQPRKSRVINATRFNGQFPVRMDDGSFRPGNGPTERIPTIAEYRGWKSVPYILFENENLRDRLGFSDVATMLPIQDSTNRFLSQQQDVIAGESRPKFKYRGDADRQITLAGEDVVSLDPDEDIEQIQVHLDVFPTQVHGTQLADVMSRATGLPDTVWGRITSAQNSGRALSTAWRAVAARLVPRTMANDRAIHAWIDMWVDWMELYGWDSARELYQGDRDYELEFPNQEPRDFTEVSMDAINKLGAGIIDMKKARELTGDPSPDETGEAVRADYLDVITHPEKAQAYLLLDKAKQDIAIQAQQAGMQQAMLSAQLQGAGTGPSTEQAAGAATQAQTQAAQQAAPTRGEGDNRAGPATQAGQNANAVQTGTLVQDGRAFNRFIQKGELG